MKNWVTQYLELGIEIKKANEKYLQWLKRKKPNNLDVTMQQIHNSVFKKRDCLECANCCKTTSPIFYPKDIERAAKHLRMKAVDFEKNYLRVDEDGDFVLQSSPCTFLAEDNTCDIYDSRPAACREYPHTDRKNFVQITELTYKNTLVCPAVVEMLEEVKKKFNVI
jgi:uncharacterized protein